jgi:hypothetical protein
MFGIHLGREREKVVVIADIGSGSAGVAIATMRAGGPAVVLAAQRCILPIEERTEAATIAGIGEQISKAAKAALMTYREKKHTHAPEELYCIMRAPWTRSKTTQVEWSFDIETIITEKVIEGLAHKALTEDTELDKKNIFEASIIRVELNEYATGIPVGKRAKKISVTVVMSDCNAQVKSTVTSSLQKSFSHLQPIFRSTTRALIAVLNGGSKDNTDHLVIDMGSEGTSLLLLQNGAAVEHGMIKEGMRSILKRLSGSGMPEETLSIFRMMTRDECTSAACEAMQASMAKVEPELVRIFGETLATIASVRRLPNSVLLLAHPDMSPWLLKFFSRIDFTQFTLTAQPFTPAILTSQGLSRWVLADTGVVLDTQLALGCALVNIQGVRS